MTGHWHTATLRVRPEDARVQSVISEERYTRPDALAAMQQLLDRLATEDPTMGQLAAAWRAGAKDAWVYRGLVSFTIFECRDRCAVGVQAFLDDYAATLRRSGLRRVSVVRIPGS